MDTKQQLIALKPEKEFFIGIDSDGCVFDTMEIKQKECFCPNFIKYFDLQKVQKAAREVWEFVNLYSIHRGLNRFNALLFSIDLLGQRKEVALRHAIMPDLTPVREWVAKETKLGNPALTKYAAEVKNPVIDQTLAWSIAVNESISDMVHDIPPFSFVNESLDKMVHQADLMVASQASLEALTREWKENNIDHYIRMIAGQEYGTKTEHLKYAAVGKYAADKILMIGDAMGDLKAAKSNGVLFYPVNPGHEDASWERFYKEAIDRFFSGTYAGAYEASLINEFKVYLPEKPDWS